MELHDVVVVGAGPSGLAVAGCLRSRGVDPLVLERSGSVGGVWSTRYDRLHLHTVRRLSGLPDFWETLDEIESGAIKRLAALTEDRRWEVIFLTSRPPSDGSTVQRQSQRWLERHGFPLPSAYVVQGSRGLIAKALQIDLVIDDRPENCLDVVLESQAGAILVWRGHR